ncbi:MAG: hypothetical protein PHP06_04220 [Clostridia bacterium]|nr:hypothetical protein [Clostridia bacterium]
MDDLYMKRYLPGANTYKGFFSFYKNLLDGLKRVFIIKGGPGTGKSTFINRLATYFGSKGHNIELLCCSGDVSAYDGLIITDRGIAIVDGTSPHILDPENPGAVEEILDFGQLWNDRILIKNKDEIVNINEQMSNNYLYAYKLLETAKSIHDNLKDIYKHNMNFNKNYEIESNLIQQNINDFQSKKAKQRHMFATAITHHGYVNYYNSITKNSKKKIAILGEPGTGKSTLIKHIGETAFKRGYDVDFYHCGFAPDSIDLVDIKDINMILFDADTPHEHSVQADYKIDLNENLNQTALSGKKEDIKRLKKTFDDFINNAVRYLDISKTLHDSLEKYYKNAMCFSELESLSVQVIDKIEYYMKAD